MRELIRRMAVENRYGAPRIHGEILKLGIDVSERSVSNYLKKLFPHPEHRLQQWRAFLRNEAVAAMDFVAVYTATAGVLYAFVVLAHGRRKVLHVNATAHPTAAWVSQQLREAFPGDKPLPRYLIHDGDAIFRAAELQATIRSFGIKPVRIAYYCPWQNGILERFNGTLRRELLRQVIIFSERHLVRLLREYAVFYNTYRTHLTLNKDSPIGRKVTCRPSEAARVTSIAHLGGLHHHYVWSGTKPANDSTDAQRLAA